MVENPTIRVLSVTLLLCSIPPIVGIYPIDPQTGELLTGVWFVKMMVILMILVGIFVCLIDATANPRLYNQ